MRALETLKHDRVRASVSATLGGIDTLAEFVKIGTVAVSLTVPAGSLAQSVYVQVHEADKRPLTAAIKPYVDSHEIAGAVVCIADRNRVIDRETIGYADMVARRSMKANNMFWIASMSKAITASAVMMLVDETKISLDDPVVKYLPEFKSQMVNLASDQADVSFQQGVPGSVKAAGAFAKLAPLRQPITIRELLSHTSGLPFTSTHEAAELDLFPLRTAVDSYAAEPLQSQPGGKYSYSNEGFNIAGRIVEVVSGFAFEDFLEQRLFSPLGMKDTTFWPNNEQVKRLAKSYETGGVGVNLREVPIDVLTYPLSDHEHRFPIPAGGLFSTADDIVRFCQMILNRGTFHGTRYLSEESVRLMTIKETGDIVAKSYGFGWNVDDGYLEHSGAYKTDMIVDKKRGLIVVFLVQCANDWKLEDRKRLMGDLQQRVIAAFGDTLANQ